MAAVSLAPDPVALAFDHLALGPRPTQDLGYLDCFGPKAAMSAADPLPPSYIKELIETDDQAGQEVYKGDDLDGVVAFLQGYFAPPIVAYALLDAREALTSSTVLPPPTSITYASFACRLIDALVQSLEIAKDIHGVARLHPDSLSMYTTPRSERISKIGFTGVATAPIDGDEGDWTVVGKSDAGSRSAADASGARAIGGARGRGRGRGDDRRQRGRDGRGRGPPGPGVEVGEPERPHVIDPPVTYVEAPPFTTPTKEERAARRYTYTRPQAASFADSARTTMEAARSNDSPTWSTWDRYAQPAQHLIRMHHGTRFRNLASFRCNGIDIAGSQPNECSPKAAFHLANMLEAAYEHVAWAHPRALGAGREEDDISVLSFVIDLRIVHGDAPAPDGGPPLTCRDFYVERDAEDESWPEHVDMSYADRHRPDRQPATDFVLAPICTAAWDVAENRMIFTGNEQPNADGIWPMQLAACTKRAADYVNGCCTDLLVERRRRPTSL